MAYPLELHHRESTLLRRFEALIFAPLLGIDRLSEFDTHAHPLKMLFGRGYPSTRLSQFLEQLERMDAAEALLPAMVEDPAGQIIYVAGHMIVYWSRRSMHKGKITMLDRIMAGLQTVITHDETGQAVFVASYPPAMYLSQVIMAYCQQGAEATGSTLFVIDQTVNAVAMAQAFHKKDLGLLCILDDNEHVGLGSFEATFLENLNNNTKAYTGRGKSAAQVIPGTLGSSNLLRARPW